MHGHGGVDEQIMERRAAQDEEEEEGDGRGMMSIYHCSTLDSMREARCSARGNLDQSYDPSPWSNREVQRSPWGSIPISKGRTHAKLDRPFSFRRVGARGEARWMKKGPANQVGGGGGATKWRNHPYEMGDRQREEQ